MSTSAQLPLGPAVLALDYDREIERICARLREILSRDLSRRGLVVAISGGIDSSVSATLSVKALGAERVYGLLLPEHDSSGFSVQRGRMLAEHLGIEFGRELCALRDKQIDDHLLQISDGDAARGNRVRHTDAEVLFDLHDYFDRLKSHVT